MDTLSSCITANISINFKQTYSRTIPFTKHCINENKLIFCFFGEKNEIITYQRAIKCYFLHIFPPFFVTFFNNELNTLYF